MKRETTPRFLLATCSRAAFIQYVSDIAREQPAFWQNYKFMNPATKKIEPKQMYCERLNEIMVCGGDYKEDVCRGAKYRGELRRREFHQRRGICMAKATFICLIIATAIIGINVTVSAQDVDLGKTAYLSSCAPCHGADARGPGTLAIIFKLQPPDLTTLAKRNDGEFPARAANEIIDGLRFVEAHGTRDMPIWGFDVMVKSRITAIVDYLRRIQEK